MGCIWSNEDRERCLQCNRRAVNNLVFIDNVCQICIARPSRSSTTFNQLRAQYGEYKCSSCGRFWSSRLSWARAYQLCKRCQIPVYPHYQRDLVPGDLTHSGKDSTQEHQRQSCQMCQQLGYSCANYGKKVPGKGNSVSRPPGAHRTGRSNSRHR